MAINVRPPIVREEEDVTVDHSDAELIKRVAIDIGKIEAIRVTRWLTKASLMTSKRFVEALCEPHG